MSIGASYDQQTSALEELLERLETFDWITGGEGDSPAACMESDILNLAAIVRVQAEALNAVEDWIKEPHKFEHDQLMRLCNAAIQTKRDALVRAEQIAGGES